MNEETLAPTVIESPDGDGYNPITVETDDDESRDVWIVQERWDGDEHRIGLEPRLAEAVIAAIRKHAGCPRPARPPDRMAILAIISRLDHLSGFHGDPAIGAEADKLRSLFFPGEVPDVS